MNFFEPNQHSITDTVSLMGKALIPSVTGLDVSLDINA